ncbi:hypothetical protein AFV7_gp36 [Betalipothrixvirus pezzuloense]|uniref:Uncharacterized protein n=1 Tax=Betalipothrixvirus pezzuloense TaxID=346883 RepID=A7WKQ4_9VIRU|nr:hypothetical protein AFV7_gp36 [Acidianus filamentous virus 7]CAJ31656.1 conserved hypothetical protein [Acidianus filamentous virus 7]
MSIILDIQFATYEIASFLLMIWYIYRLNKSRKEDEDKKLHKLIVQLVESEEFQEKIKQIVETAINESPQTKLLNQIILVLCTYIPELKNSKLCNP